MLAETNRYVHSVGTVNFHPEFPEWATKDCKVRMYIPEAVTPYSRQDDLLHSVEAHQNDLRKQLDRIKEQLEYSLQHRCGEWAPRIAEQMMDEIKEIEDPQSEAHLLNFIDLTYNIPRMNESSRKCMMELATQIKENHAKQTQKEKEKEPRTTGNTTGEPCRNRGVFLTLYNPNRPGLNQDGEAIWIDLGTEGKKLDVNAMGDEYKDPDERKIRKTQPKGPGMRK